VSDVKVHAVVSDVKVHAVVSDVKVHAVVSDVKVHAVVSDVKVHAVVSDVKVHADLPLEQRVQAQQRRRHGLLVQALGPKGEYRVCCLMQGPGDRQTSAVTTEIHVRHSYKCACQATDSYDILINVHARIQIP
jgi:hypothetical protein